MITLSEHNHNVYNSTIVIPKEDNEIYLYKIVEGLMIKVWTLRTSFHVIQTHSNLDKIDFQGTCYDESVE